MILDSGEELSGSVLAVGAPLQVMTNLVYKIARHGVVVLEGLCLDLLHALSSTFDGICLAQAPRHHAEVFEVEAELGCAKFAHALDQFPKFHIAFAVSLCNCPAPSFEVRNAILYPLPRLFEAAAVANAMHVLLTVLPSLVARLTPANGPIF